MSENGECQGEGNKFFKDSFSEPQQWGEKRFLDEYAFRTPTPQVALKRTRAWTKEQRDEVQRSATLAARKRMRMQFFQPEGYGCYRCPFCQMAEQYAYDTAIVENFCAITFNYVMIRPIDMAEDRFLTLLQARYDQLFAEGKRNFQIAFIS